jgi:MarR family transcriptional regulator, transcriptional regulator for hemolysin
VTDESRTTPQQEPIGRALAAASKRVSAAFNASLAAEGGSAPAWLILTSLRRSRWRSQRDLAGSLGIVGPTLTRHIDNLEQAGWVVRTRSADDRRAVRVEITAAGVEAHGRMRKAVTAFDRRLRAGLSQEEADTFRALLDRLVANAEGGP